jgi:hypothetical protein
MKARGSVMKRRNIDQLKYFVIEIEERQQRPKAYLRDLYMRDFVCERLCI